MSGSRTAVNRLWVSSDDYEKLRGSFDGKDKFMQFPNVVAARVGRRRRIELTLQDRDTILKSLRRKFPKANKPDSTCECIPCKHPGRTNVSRAGCSCVPCKRTTLFLKWYVVIFECFIGDPQRKTGSQVERGYGWKYGTVDYISQQIRRWAAGERLDGKPRTGRKRGRPRKWAAQYPACNFGSVAIAGQHFIFEADSPAVRERFKNQGHDFTSNLIVESSPGKGHRYYLSASGVENVGQNKGEDFSIRANGEQCVSPGSLHPVTGRQYRVAVHNGPLTQPTAEEIQFWKSERAEKKSADVAQQAQIPSGQRNSALASIAGKLIDAGLTPEKVKQEIIEINEQRCSPPLTRQELESTIFASIDSKWSKQKDAITRQVETPKIVMGGNVLGESQAPTAASPSPTNWRDSFKSVGELEQGDVRMLINGVLPEGTTFIGGLPGEGKTLFALSIAKALTTGDPFLGKFFVPETVPVIYLIPESGGRAFRKRCEKFNIPNDPELFLCRTVSEC
jgi:AAA domain/Primase C terminal 1 (PriCT-1)/Bifunctional DNA primase/polymerase, N-terminal